MDIEERVKEIPQEEKNGVMQTLTSEEKQEENLPSNSSNTKLEEIQNKFL